MASILVVDDDRLMRRSVCLSLENIGYDVETAVSGEEALEKAQVKTPDLVLLDIGLPGIDGLETLRYFQKSFQVPIIFVTGRRRELDEVVGLELGADDYITKPFDMDVLLARIKAVLRRTRARNQQPAAQGAVDVGTLHINPTARIVRIGDREVGLAPKEFDLLFYLARRAGEAVPLEDILRMVWGEEWIGETQTVYVHVRWLRTKIEDDPNNPTRLLTVRSVGYKLVPGSGGDS